MKPTLIDISRWEKEYYSLRMPAMTKDEFIKRKKNEWYREQYHKKG